MASFYAELQVAGSTYPVRYCVYKFTQATNQRGQAVAKVRHGLVQLTLDVPTDDTLLDWAATPYKPLAGRILFYNAKGGPALETLAWENGECVGYQEEFASGNLTYGAYICHLTIAAPKLTIQSGGPGTYESPAPGEHGTPPLAAAPLLVAEEEVVATTLPELVAEPTLAELLTSAGAAAMEGVAAVATVAALPLLLTLGLLLGSTTPAGGPGIDQHLPPPLSPDALRLLALEAKQKAGSLTPDEEAELIILLGKVKGIHVNRLQDLADPDAPALPMRGGHVPLRNFTYLRNFAYTKRSEADRLKLRNEFNKKHGQREAFLLDLAKDPDKMARMKKLGMSEDNLDRIKVGLVPKGYRVHHKLPLDDGGDNSFANLVVIQDDPYHLSVTVLQNTSTRALAPNETQVLDWPTINDYIYPNY